MADVGRFISLYGMLGTRLANIVTSALQQAMRSARLLEEYKPWMLGGSFSSSQCSHVDEAPGRVACFCRGFKVSDENSIDTMFSSISSIYTWIIN